MPFNPFIAMACFADPVESGFLYDTARRVHPDFPRDACAVTLSLALKRAGLEQLALDASAEGLARKLKALGWQVADQAEEPHPGDVFVTEDLNGNGLADHIGLVICPSAPGWFVAGDNQMGNYGGHPYRRNIGPGKKTPVAYWLRSGGVA